MTIHSLNQHRAQKLHEEGEALHEEGREDEAIAKYEEAIQLAPDQAGTHYNLGLIYKYRGDWQRSFDHNLTANALDPEDEATRWNIAIAATALRRWDVVRKAWHENGVEMAGEGEPTGLDFGPTPVRLNPDERGEVVWARRIDPVRARIVNIPYPESGFHFGDIVLHDGAAEGHRMNGDQEYPVFNVLELFERSPFETWTVTVRLNDMTDVESLERDVAPLQSSVEDWSGNVRILCRQCSEGRPHEQHDHELKTPWTRERRLGVAVHPDEDVESLLKQWAATTGSEILEIQR